MNAKETLDKLKKMGIARVEVSYSGGNDSGGCDGVKIYLKPEDTESAYELEDGDLHDSLCQPVYDKYYSFNNEPEVHGRLIWNSVDNAVGFDGWEIYTRSEAMNETVYDAAEEE